MSLNGKGSEPLSGAEKVMPYGTGAGKETEVERMFDSIAPAYDLMNTAMTFGLHRRWRDKALDALSARLRGHKGKLRVLDVATGTGDVAFRLAEKLRDVAVTGIDLSAGMLEVARGKLERIPAGERPEISFEKADCLDLPFEAETFDAVTVAYGVRNFARLPEGYREMLRVLRKGGYLCVIELSEPENPVLHTLYRLYSRHLIPLAGRMASGDSRAYTYLPESIAAAPQRTRMTEIMLKCGFAEASFRSLTFGAVTIYMARK